MEVTQTSKSAVSQVSKPANRVCNSDAQHFFAPADLGIGDTAGLETCATLHTRAFVFIGG
jgi:hypothetical protein